MKLAFTMAVGPGEFEMVVDNLEAIESLYPQAETWLRDDVTKDGTWERLVRWSTGKKVHISRNPTPHGYYRIAQTYGQLLLEIVPFKPDLLIKIDPDTVLLRQGLDALVGRQFAEYGAGICGSYRTSPTGGNRNFRHHSFMVMLDVLPIGPEKKVKGLRWKPVGYFPYVVRALLNGYKLGENVQGGLYAIDGSTLAKLSQSGFLKAMAFGQRGMVWTEDVLLTLGVKAVGGVISPLNEDVENRPTHIQALRPLIIDSTTMSSPQMLAVHPVKSDDVKLRSFFRSLRKSAVLQSPPHSPR